MACYSHWDIVGCGCATCFVRITVNGCTAGQLGAGIDVRIRTASGGTILDAGTTDASGQVVLAIPGPTGTYWVEADVAAVNSRFVNYAASRTVTCGTSASPGSLTIGAAAAAGYACGCCNIPLPTTLHATTEFGTVDITYSGGQWQGTFNYSYGGCIRGLIDFPTCVIPMDCAARTVPIKVTLSGCVIHVEYPYLTEGCSCTCPYTSFAGSTGSCDQAAYFAYTIACPPAFSITGSGNGPTWHTGTKCFGCDTEMFCQTVDPSTQSHSASVTE